MKYKYRVVNYREGNRVVGKYTTLKGARRAVDRLDNEYGAYSFRVETIDGGFAI
jgi:hypothetical protein